MHSWFIDCACVYVLCASSSFLTAVMVSLASWVRVVAVTLACLERYWGGRGLPVTASPRTTDSPFPWGWYLCVCVCVCVEGGGVWVCAHKNCKEQHTGMPLLHAISSAHPSLVPVQLQCKTWRFITDPEVQTVVRLYSHACA